MEKKQIFTKDNIVKGLKWFFFSFIWLAVLMFIIDIVTKQVVKNYMDLNSHIVLIPNFLEIHYIQNNGMAFGIDFGNKLANAIVFIAVSLIGAIAMIFVLVKYWKKLDKLPKAALMLALSGTIGNLIDRAFYVDAQGNHYVVDFIGINFGPKASFPRFNVADSCLVIGVIMLLIYFIVKDIKESKAKKAEEALQTEGEVNKIVVNVPAATNKVDEEKPADKELLNDKNSNSEVKEKE